MREIISLLLPMLFPVLMGILLLIIRPLKNRKLINIYTGIVLAVSLVLVMNLMSLPEKEMVLFYLTQSLPIAVKADLTGKLFLLMILIVWICAGFYSFSYMEKEAHPRRYFGFYLITLGILVGLGISGNLITMYAFYELLTIVSFILVIHTQSRESVMAALKYLLYSFFGAYMALFGVFFLCRYTKTLSFTVGGTLDLSLVSGHETLLLVVVCLMILGFGVKAGMFPLHAWLPTAHPVAPAPASAVLSGIIVKAGVFAILRVVFYLVGPEFIQGTWVQTMFLTLSLVTVFMGSMLAFREKVLKKRLAYSTVSQLSYILFGIALLDPTALNGSFLHMLAHAFIKSALFLCAGAIIHQTGKTTVDELVGIGKMMPVTIWCYTIVSLALIGIPPTGGFISKWYLATGALSSGIEVFRYLGPIILLVSALLTAGYLLPITIKGFFPGEDFDYSSLEKKEADEGMMIPIIILTLLSVWIGMFPQTLLDLITSVTSTLM